jgi:cell division protease FtsH
VLDPALIRPGRFDRQIRCRCPTSRALEILKVHAKKVTLGPDVNLERVARGTPMFSGADLAAIINEAAIGATMQNKDFIEHEDLEEARDKVKFGRAKRAAGARGGREQARRVPRGGARGAAGAAGGRRPAAQGHDHPARPRAGATFSLPEKDRMGYSLKWLRATMRVLCGGRIAEEKAMEDVSSGAAQDIQQVTQLARHMVLDWGMSDKLGFIKYSRRGQQGDVHGRPGLLRRDGQDHRRGGPPDRRRGVRRRDADARGALGPRQRSPRRCSSTRRWRATM